MCPLRGCAELADAIADAMTDGTGAVSDGVRGPARGALGERVVEAGQGGDPQSVVVDAETGEGGVGGRVERVVVPAAKRGPEHLVGGVPVVVTRVDTGGVQQSGDCLTNESGHVYILLVGRGAVPLDFHLNGHVPGCPTEGQRQIIIYK